MRIGKIGEFGLIERMRKEIHTNASVVKGSGDDCAVLKFSRKYYQLFTCDMLVEGVDFRSGENPYLVGRKSVAVSASDIAACAGIPQHCLISCGLPKNTPLKYSDALFRGMRDIAKEFGINIVGGDLSRSEKIIIDVSLLGLVEKKFLVLRGGAKAGDIIFVSGSLGGSLKGKHLKFTPRVKEARFLVKNFKINAMIDISDGLLQDLGHILKESRKGALVYETRIPLSSAARNLNSALYNGEDFELLFSASCKEAEKILGSKIFNFFPVGKITSGSGGLKLVDKTGREKTAILKGYRHF